MRAREGRDGLNGGGGAVTERSGVAYGGNQ